MFTAQITTIRISASISNTSAARAITTSAGSAQPGRTALSRPALIAVSHGTVWLPCSGVLLQLGAQPTGAPQGRRACAASWHRPQHGISSTREHATEPSAPVHVQMPRHPATGIAADQLSQRPSPAYATAWESILGTSAAQATRVLATSAAGGGSAMIRRSVSRCVSQGAEWRQ